MSHHISNNFTSTSSNNQADLTTAKADIVAIKAKTDFLSITQNVNLDVIETDTLNNKLDVATLNSQLANSVASTLKTNIDANTSARTTNATNIANNLTIISGHTSAIGANLLARTQNATDIATNSASITTINNAYPRETTIRQFALTSGDIYNDGKIKFYWDAANRQLRFWILDIPSGQYTVGGVERWVGTGITRVANYISQNNSTYYHYFTGPQLGGAVLNSSFNLSSSYARATYFLTPYSTNDYPSYEIIVLVGYSAGYNTITIKRLI